jgi:hypothetical protein
MRPRRVETDRRLCPAVSVTRAADERRARIAIEAGRNGIAEGPVEIDVRLRTADVRRSPERIGRLRPPRCADAAEQTRSERRRIRNRKPGRDCQPVVDFIAIGELVIRGYDRVGERRFETRARGRMRRIGRARGVARERKRVLALRDRRRIRKTAMKIFAVADRRAELLRVGERVCGAGGTCTARTGGRRRRIGQEHVAIDVIGDLRSGAFVAG